MPPRPGYGCGTLPGCLPGCCRTGPEELFMEMSNGEMEVTCALGNDDVAALFFVIGKRGGRQRLPLSALDLHNSKLSSRGVRRVAKCLADGFKELRSLNLSHCLGEGEDRLQRGDCAALAAALTLQPRLHTLNLSHLGLAQAHISLLCPAFALPLEVLDLSGNRINNQGALRLFQLRHPTLRKLHLHNNEVRRDIVLHAHPLVPEMPRLAYLSVFSLENDLPLFTDPDEAARLRQLQEARQSEQQRVMEQLRQYTAFFGPTLDDHFRCYKTLVAFNAETGECDFGPDVAERPQITWVFPALELPLEEAMPGTRCIAEYHTGTGATLAYALCEVHEGFPNLQVRFSSRVVNPQSPEVPEFRAFNRLRELRDSSESATPLKAVAQSLTGVLYRCPECFRASFAEKDARKATGPHVHFINLEQLLEMWGLASPPPCPSTESSEAGEPELLLSGP
eukprot:EG_transcript_7545